MTQTLRLTAPAIAARKGGQPLVCLTAYTAPMAKTLDAHCDLLLVGDSVAMVLYGLDSTLGADVDMMVRHGQAVVRSSQKACVVVDMPFGSYQATPAQAFENAARILKETGAQAIKLEGGAEMAKTIAFLTSRGVPVMGHIGLQPQSVNTLGGYKAQGRDESSSMRIRKDAQAIAQAGAFAVVIEGVAEPLAAAITKEIQIPTIGIGASSACDGQILVTEDMLGITSGKKPKFVKEYAALSATIDAAVAGYAREVKARVFPGEAHTYAPRPAQIATAPVNDRPAIAASPTTPAKIAAPAQQQAIAAPSPVSFSAQRAAPPVQEPETEKEDRPMTMAYNILRAIPRRMRDE
jgi:3-methyl-2-oxobutanoate hydroxymethyltransferase